MISWLLGGQVSPAPRHRAAAEPDPWLSKGGSLCPQRPSGWLFVVRKFCSQPVPQLPPFLCQAFSAFFYTVDFIRTVMGRPVHLPNDLKDAAKTICATSWSEVGSSGMVGRRGLLCVGHHPGSESSPWRRLSVLGGWVTAPTWDKESLRWVWAAPWPA